MVKTQNLTPKVYYDKSRDFQLIGRLFDLVFGYMKNASEIFTSITDTENLDSDFVDLLALTLGFEETHEYNINQLKSLCSVFSLALKNKGNITSINYLLNLLANVENYSGTLNAVISEENPYLLQLFVPAEITDLSLFEDTLKYVIPAGMSYIIIRQELITTIDPITDSYHNVDTVSVFENKRHHSYEYSQVMKIDSETDLPKESDIALGRLDDTIVSPYDADNIGNYVKNEGEEEE